MKKRTIDQAKQILKESTKTISSKIHIILKCILTSDEISEAIISLLIQDLKDNKLPITSINFSGNKLGIEWVKLIAEALKVNKSLTEIDLSYSNIGAKGAQAIAEVLKGNKTVTSISLKNNNIGTEGAKAIAKVLKGNKIVTSIDLSYNNIGTEGAKAIAEVLKGNKTLTSIELENGTIIRDETAQWAAEALKVNKTLTSIVLEDGVIWDKKAKAIAEDLKINKTLTSIDLSNNEVGYKAEKAIAEAIEANKNYIKEIADFLSKGKAKDVTEEIKYLKAYQAIDKELLASELKAKGIEDTESFLKDVDQYIKEHLFQLSGIAKDPVAKILPGREILESAKSDSFSLNDLVKLIFGIKLNENTDEVSSKSTKITEVEKSNIFNDPLISSTIAEFLGGNQSLFEIKLPQPKVSDVKQIGENPEIYD